MVPPMQTDADQRRNFGQPVVSEFSLTPAQAAAQFEIPSTCFDRLAPTVVAAFAESWRTARQR
jgi:hypothetical protein